jgi:hypothetical protein
MSVHRVRATCPRVTGPNRGSLTRPRAQARDDLSRFTGEAVSYNRVDIFRIN